MFVQRCPQCGSSRIQLGYNDAPLWLRLIGVYDLLCNNCDLEFRGFALPPGAVKRARRTIQVKVSEQSSAGNQRRSPRVKVHVPTRMFIYKTEEKIRSSQYSPVLVGYTRDLSEIGMGTVLPLARFSDEYLAKDHRRLLLILELPSNAVQIYATAVRFELLPQNAADHGLLIGTRITKISPGDRARLLNYLKAAG